MTTNFVSQINAFQVSYKTLLLIVLNLFLCGVERDVQNLLNSEVKKIKMKTKLEKTYVYDDLVKLIRRNFQWGLIDVLDVNWKTNIW